MGKIYFNYRNDWTEYIATTISILFIVFGLVTYKEAYGLFIAFNGLLILIIDLSKFFWFKNQLVWSKHVVYIKFGTTIGHFIKFKDIKSCKFEKSLKFFEITKTNGNSIVLSTRGVVEPDVLKLKEIIETAITNKQLS